MAEINLIFPTKNRQKYENVPFMGRFYKKGEWLSPATAFTVYDFAHKKGEKEKRKGYTPACPPINNTHPSYIDIKIFYK